RAKMRALLNSDTHRKLDIINQLIEKTNADIVIHAGDFGFYDETSYQHLSSRELLLLITHSPYRNEYSLDKADKETLVEIVKKHHLLGDFDDYLNQRKKFQKPVYAVYGNHEDVGVIRKLKANPIMNFHLLDEDNIYSINENKELAFRVFGLGGNFLVGQKMLNQPIAGSSGKVWATLHQFGVLYQKLEDKTKPSVFVSHVSPGKEPLLTRLMIHFMPNFWVSGHMGAPYTCVWNQFTIREMDESIAWFGSQLNKLDALQLDNATSEAKLAIELIKRQVQRDEFWFKKMWNVNLPDAKDGCAVLNYDNGRFCLEQLVSDTWFE
ncbi:MAG: metallophosphoesterase, partial [Candidatus Berkiella sp.]